MSAADLGSLATEIINRLAIIESKLDIGLKILAKVDREEEEQTEEGAGFGRTSER